MLTDIGTYAGGGYGNRSRLPGYSQKRRRREREAAAVIRR
jgi:hypothetical protein